MPMPSFLNKFKAKATGHSENPTQGNEPTYGILPHPAVRLLLTVHLHCDSSAHIMFPHTEIQRPRRP
jgi:hypothetical protein